MRIVVKHVVTMLGGLVDSDGLEYSGGFAVVLGGLGGAEAGLDAHSAVDVFEDDAVVKEVIDD